MLWIPSETYSRFLELRLQATHSVVLKLHNLPTRLPSHIILSGILSYILQALMSTPVNQKSFTTAALAELRLGSTVAHQGLFFLHTLNLNMEKSFGLGLDATDTYDVINQSKVRLLPRKVTFYLSYTGVNEH